MGLADYKIISNSSVILTIFQTFKFEITTYVDPVCNSWDHLIGGMFSGKWFWIVPIQVSISPRSPTLIKIRLSAGLKKLRLRIFENNVCGKFLIFKNISVVNEAWHSANPVKQSIVHHSSSSRSNWKSNLSKSKLLKIVLLQLNLQYHDYSCGQQQVSLLLYSHSSLSLDI